MQNPAGASTERIEGETEATGNAAGASPGHTHERDRDDSDRPRCTEDATAGEGMESVDRRQGDADGGPTAD